MKKTNIAIIGCGVIGPVHAESFAMNNKVALVTACDTVRARAEKMAATFGFAKTATSPEQVFADPSIDAVSICTPHYNHARLCEQALAAGKDVLCEKPIANTVEGIELVRKAFRKYPDRIFAGVFQHRYNPVFRTLRELVADGSFGTPLTAAVHNRCLRTADYYNADAWRGTSRYERGGVLINQAIHYLDIFQWVMGGLDPRAPVHAFKANRAHKGVIETEDDIAGVVRFANGAFGTVEATNAAIVGWDTQLDITGTAGYVIVRDGNVEKSQFADPAVSRRLEKAQKAHDTAAGRGVGRSYYGPGGHPAQIADFIECVRSRRQPWVTAADACDAAELVLRLYSAANRQK